MNRQKPDGIGWCNYTWNPVKGKCPVGCSYCYARRFYDRFHYDPEIRMDARELTAPREIANPALIFVGSTIELFHPKVPESWILAILYQIREYPHHTFLFLTKLPLRMMKFEFPKNCWCGVTVTCDFEHSRIFLVEHVDCRLRFISFEPLHGFISASFRTLDWVIIGAETGNRKGKIKPKEEWIAHILDQADHWKIPVFMKNNLKPYWHERLRQEFPKVKNIAIGGG
jgi:protein gp37